MVSRSSTTRYLPNKTYPEAKAALLAHFDLRCRWGVEVIPGYFVSAAASVSGTDEESLDENAWHHPERELVAATA